MTRHVWISVSVMALTMFGGPARGIAVAQPPIVQQSGSSPSISPEALAQIAALKQEKASRTPAERKVASQILYAIKMQHGELVAPGVHLRQPRVPRDASGRFNLNVSAHAGTNLHALLADSGASVASVFVARTPGGKSVARAYLDADRVLALAARGEVTAIRPHQAYRLSGATGLLPKQLPGLLRTASLSGQGSVNTEGDVTHQADLARQAFGVDGTGIKIGVLSDGVTSLATSQGSNDLGPVTVLTGQAGTGDEGTAMLEIIHDLAPGAQLYFATGTASLTQFAQNILDLRAAGCDIIVDDIQYLEEAAFQDGQPAASTPTDGGLVTQAVNTVTADGAVYFTAAGDTGNLDDGTSGVWEGDYVSTASPDPAPLAGANLHDFGGGQNSVQVTSHSSNVTLHWSDPLGTSANDYDIYVMDGGLTTIFDASTDVQDGVGLDDEPFEHFGDAFGGERLLIDLFAGTGRFLHVDVHGATLSISTPGAIYGHGAAAAAFSVAATPAAARAVSGTPGPYPGAFTTSDTVETSTSDGPRRIFFLADGTPITPGNFSSTGGTLRQKPDITAADGVQITGAGGFSTPFYGSSAAAAHAAAIAALLKQGSPAATPAEIRTWLLSTALDIGTPGVDRDSGAGIIMPIPALVAAGVTGQPVISLGAQTVAENPGNGDGALYGGEGGRVTIVLKNTGFATATGVQATLTTTTPGVTMTAPTLRTYGDIAASGAASNAIPFTFTLPSDTACGLIVNFTLDVTYDGGGTATLQFPVATGVLDVTQVFDGTAPSGATLFTGAAGQQSNILTRNAVASACTVKTFPGSTVVAPIGYESYALTTCPSSAASCAQIQLTAPPGSSQQLFSTAYNGSFDPTDLASGYLGDLGQTRTDGVAGAYGVNLDAGSQTLVVTVNELTAGAATGANYRLQVSGACFASCTRNQVPVAHAHDIVLAAGVGGLANGTVDNGSFDPDGDPLTIVAAPAGPYPTGSTPVLLTVSDDKGATSQDVAIVTVVPAVTVTGINPTTGAASGGTVVTITGTGFSTTPGGTTVSFGATAATGVVCVSSTSCQATSPAGTGLMNVRVTASTLTSPDTAADDFTYAAAPTITAITPARGTTAGGTIVSITGTGFSTTPGATTIQFGAAAGTNISCASTTACVVTSPAGTGSVSVRATVDAQISADTAADDFAYATQVYLLAEGATGAFFDEDVLIANPNLTDAPITAAFYTEGGIIVTDTRTIAAQSRTTLHVDAIPGLEATSLAAVITSEQGLPLAVERTMFWDASYYAGHTGPAVAAPATQWFFAEGAQGFFDTFILVNNPNSSPVDVTFTFLREQEAPVVTTVTVGPTSRYTLAASSVAGLEARAFGIALTSTQPVTADRSMYFGTTETRIFGGGMASPGMALAPTWYFAEGATGGFFDTFFLLGNPQASDAHVTLAYLLDSGEVVTTQQTVPAHGRLTINPEASSDPRLQNAAFSTTVTSDAPIVAERSMYWAGKATPWGEGHTGPGVPAPALTWDLAEGRAGGEHQFHSYILVSNPQNTPADLTVTYLREAGAPVVRTYTVPATGRLTIDANAVPELADQNFGARVAVTNSVPVIVERSMYWNANGIFWSGGSNGTGVPVPMP